MTSRYWEAKYTSARRRASWALRLVADALNRLRAFPTDPALATRALAIPFGVAEHETSWGLGWPPGSEMVGSLNLGGIHGGLPPCREGEVLHTDHTQAGVEYSVCFKTYDTWESATDDLIVEVYRRRPLVWTTALSGALIPMVNELYRAHYFGGLCGKGNTYGNVGSYLYALLPTIAAADDALHGGAADHTRYWGDWQQAERLWLERDGSRDHC